MEYVITRRQFVSGIAVAGASIVLGGTVTGCTAQPAENPGANAGTHHLRLLATSDTHGKMLPWDYATNAEDATGSMAQLSTAIKGLRDENTLVLDSGDTAQGNFSELFNGSDETHPMIQAMNAIGYDAWTAGNHEFNFGMDHLRKLIVDQTSKPLLGNVRDENGQLFCDPYTIVDKGGVRVGLIGMVTPNITRWDARNLEGCAVTDPAEETNKIIEQIKDQTDILILLLHASSNDEYDMPHSGYESIAQDCPALDIIIGAHGHTLNEGEQINGVLCVENKASGKTLIQIDVDIRKDDNGSEVTSKTSKCIQIADYAPDEEIVSLLAKYDTIAKDFACEVIGRLEGGKLVPDDEIKGVPAIATRPSAQVELVNKAMMHYASAAVGSSAGMRALDAQPGELHRYEIAQIYPFVNTLYSYRMTGTQLKQHMEWAASGYRPYQEGDLTIAFDDARADYMHDIFSGVNYKIDLSKPDGSRIVDLTWPDGTPVDDDESFVVAVCNYRAESLFSDTEVFGEKVPELLDADIRSDIGDIRALIIDYIQNVKGGVVTPEVDDNWEIIGCNWDEDLHRKAAEQVNNGTITVTSTDRTSATEPITVQDLK